MTRSGAVAWCAGAIVALGAAACGGSRAPVAAGGDAQSTVRVAGGAGERSGQLTTTSSYRGLVDDLPVSADSAWGLMPAVYGELGIDYNTLDQTRRVIGNDALRLRQRLGDTPLSRYLACGSDNGRENANSYAVTMAVRTQVVAGTAPGTTTVVTTVRATARSRLFNSGDVECASTQQLEERVAKALKARLGG